MVVGFREVGFAEVALEVGCGVGFMVIGFRVVGFAEVGFNVG